MATSASANPKPASPNNPKPATPAPAPAPAPASANPKSSTPTKQGLNAIAMISVIKSLLHTFVRFLPLSIYSFTYLSIALYKDLRSAVLLLGLVLNDIIGMLYNKYSKPRIPATCAIFKMPKAVETVNNQKDYKQLGILPNPHTEIMGFVSAFFFSDMFQKGKFDNIPGWFLIILTALTCWSRMAIKCKGFNDILFNIMRGAIIGILFYYFLSKYYKNAEKGMVEKETCDMGYKNYKCDTIQDGVVIVKKTGEDRPENPSKDELDGYYD
jgi:hypothetical protein